MIEFEKKILLAADEYLTITLWNSKFLKDKICQTNYYYDTENLDMNEQGITCRIREINGKYTATVKKHKTDIAECSFEDAEVVTNELDDSFFEGLDVKLYGTLKTVRTIICDEIGLKVVLDKNSYLGIEDYEIEIEYSPEEIVRAHKAVQHFGENLEAVYKDFDFVEFYGRLKNPKSKSERFFARLKELEKQKEGQAK